MAYPCLLYQLTDFANRYNNHHDDYSPPNVKNGGLASHDLRNVVDLPGAAAEEVKERRRPRPKRMDNEEASKVKASSRGRYGWRNIPKKQWAQATPDFLREYLNIHRAKLVVTHIFIIPHFAEPLCYRSDE